MHEITSNEQEMLDLIDRYFRNQLTTEEEQEFENRLATDAGFRNRVTAEAILIKGVMEQGRADDEHLLALALATTDDEVCRAIGHRPRIVPLKAIVSPVLIAAAGACLFFGNRYMLDRQVADIMERADIMEQPYRDASDTFVRDYEKILRGDSLDESIHHLQQPFHTAVRDGDTQTVSIMGWHLAIAYVKQGEKDKAREVLREVLQSNPDFREAWQLYDHLSKTFFWQ